jgi:arylsulfatase A-like enzyme
MSRTVFASLAAALFCVSIPLAAAAEPARPNILFIFTDDQSYKTVRCYPDSYTWAKTPNIDALAANGVRFERSYMGAWCMPSRASLLTGRHPHGVESMRMEGDYPGSAYDPKQCPFWPSVFRKHGYHTAQIGKWHTGTDAGFGRDWDYQIVWNRPKHPKNAGNYYDNQILAFNGEERTVAGYSTDNYTKWACEYIRGEHRPKNKPWYLWLCYGGVHGPSHPAKRHVGAHKDAKVTPPEDIFPPRPGKPKYLDDTQAWSRGRDGLPVMGKSGEKFGDESGKQAKTHQAWVQQVNECVLSLDEGVGALMKALKESGQLENTLVVFTADQGFSMGEHGFRSKLAPYDANYASPLIVSMPKTIATGKVCSHPVNAPDLVVTFFKFANIELPWKMHGRDITPLLREPGRAEWHPVLYEHTGHDYGSDVTRILKEKGKAVHSQVPWYVAVRDGKYKYIRYLVANEIEEMYDLKADPEELTNLAGKPEHGEMLAQLRKTMMEELRRTEAGFIDHMPPTR